MATSVLDVRDTIAPSAARMAGTSAAPTVPARRRPPATVLAAGAVGVIEGLALLAGALTGLDGLLTGPNRPAGWIVAAVLLLLATWVVAAAGSAATLVDGTGRRAILIVSFVEVGLVGFLLVLSTAVPIPPLPGNLYPAALALLALAVPVGKLLLAGSPSAVAWAAAGPRVRERRPDPVATHRLLCALTIAGIGLALSGLAVLTPTDGPATDVAGVVSQR